MATTHTITIPESLEGQRLDATLPYLLEIDISRAYIQTLIKQGHLTLEEKTVTQASKKTQAGQTYTLTIPAPEVLDLQPENIPLNIIYEDDDLIVINKPAGMAVHPAVGNYTGTLVHALLHHCQKSGKSTLSGINGVERPGIVHRLDKDTTGLIVCAKNDVAHRHLAAQFANKTAHRTYHALVYGVPQQKSGTITGNIGRDPKNRQRMTIVPDNQGKDATTHYKVLQSFHNTLALIECTLETGRTHQIRVHLASPHSNIPKSNQIVVKQPHPIVADTQYTRPKNLTKHLGKDVQAAHEDLQHQLLHAAELTFTHPKTNQTQTHQAPRPPAFEDFLTLLA